MVQIKNRVSGLLMETGVSHNKQGRQVSASRYWLLQAVMGRAIKSP